MACLDQTQDETCSIEDFFIFKTRLDAPHWMLEAEDNETPADLRPIGSHSAHLPSQPKTAGRSLALLRTLPQLPDHLTTHSQHSAFITELLTYTFFVSLTPSIPSTTVICDSLRTSLATLCPLVKPSATHPPSRLHSAIDQCEWSRSSSQSSRAASQSQKPTLRTVAVDIHATTITRNTSLALISTGKRLQAEPQTAFARRLSPIPRNTSINARCYQKLCSVTRKRAPVPGGSIPELHSVDISQPHANLKCFFLHVWNKYSRPRLRS